MYFWRHLDLEAKRMEPQDRSRRGPLGDQEQTEEAAVTPPSRATPKSLAWPGIKYHFMF